MLEQLEKELQQMKADGKKVIVIDYILTQIKVSESVQTGGKHLRVVGD